MLLMAWRNIARNARRSMITIAAVALGLAALLFLWGFNDGVHNSMMRNLQQVIIGSIQIHQQGFFKSPKLSRDISKPDDIRDITASISGSGSWRLRTFALAAGIDTSEGLVLLGIDPEQEARATRIASKVSQGRFLKPDDTTVCVLGQTTARNLGVKLGDDVVLLSEDRFSSLAAEKFRLVGIIDSGEMGIDRGLAMVPLGFMQQWLSMEGRYSEVVLQASRERLEEVTADLRNRLEPKGYEVLRWYDMYPVMKQWVDLENGFYYIFLGIVLLIVAAGIMNTVLMSMLDRVREFGVMMALGCGRIRLAGIVVTESLMLGLIGTAIGTLLGLLLVAWFHHAGIDLSSQMDTIQRFYINTMIRTEIDTDHLLNSVLAVLFAASAAAIVPVWRVVRLQPVEAIHHV